MKSQFSLMPILLLTVICVTQIMLVDAQPSSLPSTVFGADGKFKSDIRKYQDNVAVKLRAAFPMKLQGETRAHRKMDIQFTLGPNGNISHVVFDKSNDSATNNGAFLKAVEETAPFGPLPPSLGKRATMNYEVEYVSGSKNETRLSIISASAN